ncbi:hypothetical protein PILCRDRAFT_785661 [Piloderma croceum F 1598]|uniref:PUM-HD domain-containing protein n=1 Tax=Piloderma croceum (strain F 1598) TaxID=765440 RepID=A0A0C3B7K1_PILCF|nr:hypothetical protein PILCRDRAFT_785661 [Piloderma croceum F 1598]
MSFVTDDPLSFRPFDNDQGIPRSRLSTTSIWAPQPQPPDATWPRAFDSFSRVLAERKEHSDLQRSNSFPVTKEDVFGPIGFQNDARKKNVGAIGEGRKQNSPDFDDTHVEQLLRALNLDSPAPYAQPLPLTLDTDTSYDSSGFLDDFSPISTTSALLTPTDLSPARSFDFKLHSPYDTHSQSLSPSSYNSIPNIQHHNSLLPENSSPIRPFEHRLLSSPQSPSYRSLSQIQSLQQHSPYLQAPNPFPLFEPFSEQPTPAPVISQPQLRSPSQAQLPYYTAVPQTTRHTELQRVPSVSWSQPQLPQPSDWLRPEHMPAAADFGLSRAGVGTSHGDPVLTSPSRFSYSHHSSPGSVVTAPAPSSPSHSHEPINFLSLLHPSSSPPYHVFVARIIKSSDQQASIFLQQKLKVAEIDERAKIVDAICANGFEMMAHRFGNWAVQRCLEAASTADERRKIVECMGGRIVELATNCYGCHVLQKALDCEEDIRLLIVSELLAGDPAQTLVNKHASHVWSKIMELTWTEPAPPIFAFVNKSLKGKWASLACHETGSLVVQHAFENLEDSAKDGIVDELLNQGPAVFGEVCMNQWGSYCIQHLLEHGSTEHREMAIQHLLSGLIEYAINEQGSKSILKALKEGGKDTLNRIIKRMCEPAKSARRAMIVDLALSVTGSQLIASVLPNADKDQRTQLYDGIRGHIVTLRGCKTGSKVIWLLYV